VSCEVDVFDYDHDENAQFCWTFCDLRRWNPHFYSIFFTIKPFDYDFDVKCA